MSSLMLCALSLSLSLPSIPSSTDLQLHQHPSANRSALKATAFLFPLLGMNQVIFCINPRDEDQLEDAYMLINSIFQSSQGLLVAVLYCFTNTQVKAVIKAAYYRHVMVRNVNSTRLHESRNNVKRRTEETIL